jgi:cyclic-di-AMP phosphodiesterase PgpH
MNTFSPNSFMFFKKKTPSSKRNGKKTSQPPSPPQHSGFWKKLIKNPWLYIIIFAAATAYLTSYSPSRSLPELEKGEIAPVNIVAPDNLTIEDQETTENRRREAVETILPVYILDNNVFLNTEEKIREFFKSGRDMIQSGVTASRIKEFIQSANEKYRIELTNDTLNHLIRNDFSSQLEEQLINLIGMISQQGVILTKNLFIHGEQEKGLVLIRIPGDEKSIQIEDILNIEEAREKISQETEKLELNQRQKSLLKFLGHAFIKENITYNPTETDLRRRRASQSVETVFYTIKEGKVILRKGDEVTQDVIKQINIINQNLSNKPSWILNFLGLFLLFGIMLTAALFYFRHYLKEHGLEKILMTGTTLVFSLLIYKLTLVISDLLSQNTNMRILEYARSYNYAIPFQIGPLLFTYLNGIPMGLILMVINAVIVGYLLQANFYLTIFALVGAIGAIAGISHYGKSRNSTLQAALAFLLPLNIFLIFTFHLIQEQGGSMDLFGSEIFMAVLGAVMSGAIAFLLIPLYESGFGVLTPARLQDLTNSDLPIFRKMAMEAPGSYHHSLIVASLAENAAEKINLNALLVKAGAMYHDIGKIKRPEYFIENRARNADRHKTLKPSMSTLVIVNHVKEGVEQAIRLKLPKKIQEIISQHHGDSLIRYFFEKAKEEYDPEMHKIGEESYRYSGPKPKSKEAALVMLADSVEAASRSLKNPNETNLRHLINDIFNNYLLDGQLDNSGLSIQELKIIADSFLHTLDTIYHPRIEYPGFDFERNNRKKSNQNKFKNDKHPQSTK